jgi:PAS domain S-box-containing protein
MKLTADELELFLESLLEYNNEAVCIINKDGHVLYWSHAAEKTYHIPKGDIIGQHIPTGFLG